MLSVIKVTQILSKRALVSLTQYNSTDKLADYTIFYYFFLGNYKIRVEKQERCIREK